MTGEEPRHEIDHIDTDKSNDAWANLRDVLQVTNLQNKRRARADNKLGVLGVSRTRSGRFEASLGHEGRKVPLGYHDTAEAAHAAYVAAKRQIHAGCTL